MSTKRKSSVGRGVASKKARVVHDIQDVVAELKAASQVLPEDVRSLFAKALPIILQVNKVDRHAWEGEVVAQAEKALGLINVDLAGKHKDALSKQGQVTSTAERNRREKAKTELEAKVAAAKAHLESKTAAKHAATTAVHNASNTVKENTKVVANADSHLKKVTAQKDELSAVATGDMTVLRTEGCKTASGKKAAKAVEKIGKTYGLGPTLLHSFLEASKNSGDARTDFENTTFTTLEGQLAKHVESVNQAVAAAEAEKAQKDAIVEGSKAALATAEEGLKKAEEEVDGARGGVKESEGQLRQASKACLAIWADMKEACDAADQLAADIKTFNEDLMGKFQGLKEKEPEPEPIEEVPVEEAPAEAPAAPAEATPAA